MKLTKILLEYPGAFTPRPEEEWEKNRKDYKERHSPMSYLETYAAHYQDTRDLDFEDDYESYEDAKDLLIKFPDSITKVGGDMNLAHFPNLVKLTDSLKYVKGDLWIEDCPKLEELPKDMLVNKSAFIFNCSKLKNYPKLLPEVENITSFNTGVFELPDNIKSVGSISINRSPNITHLPNSLQEVEILHLAGCPNLTTIPKHLKVWDLVVDKCPKLIIPDEVIERSEEAWVEGEYIKTYTNEIN